MHLFLPLLISEPAVMYLIRRQESIGVSALVFYCPPLAPNGETSITLPHNTHIYRQHTHTYYVP